MGNQKHKRNVCRAGKESVDLVNEVDDLDKTWAISKGIDLDIDNWCKELSDLLDVLILSNSPARNSAFKHFIMCQIENLTIILEQPMEDNNDTKYFKEKVEKYRTELTTKLKKVKF